MKIKTLLILIYIVLISFSMSVNASNAGAFLENGLGVRAIGMGMSQTGIAHDGYAAFWNPAGLMYMPGSEINSMTSTILGVVDQKFIGYASKVSNDKAFSIFYTTSGVNGIEESTYNSSTGLVSLTGGQFAYDASAVYLTTAGSLSKLLNWAFGSDKYVSDNKEIFIGASFKMICERMKNKNARGLGLDIGFMTMFTEQMNIGIQLENIISPYLEWDSPEQPAEHLLTTIKLGIGYQLADNTLLSMDLGIMPSARDPYSFSYGFEHNLWHSKNSDFFVRGGLNQNKLSYGLGIEYLGYKGDYSFTQAPEGYMSDSHRFSIGYTFNQVEQKKRTVEVTTKNENAEFIKPPTIYEPVIITPTIINQEDKKKNFTRSSRTFLL